MNLSPNRFYTGQWSYRDAAGTFHSIPIYSYETHDALFDVVIFPGGTYYRRNRGAWVGEADSPIYRAIIDHFHLTVSR